MGRKWAKEDDDAQLVAKLRRGDEAAAAALYERHLGTVRFVIRDNVRDADEIEDVVQEVFGKAFGRVDTLADATRFRAWLLQIARRSAIDARRARIRRPEMSAFEDRTLIDRRPAPADVAELRVLAAAMTDGLAGLSERDRTVLAMVVELGFSIDEVATALDLTNGAAKVVLHRARRRLRATVGHLLVAA